MKTILAFLGFGWSKWTVEQENVSMVRTQSNPILGYESKMKCFVDVQRREDSLTGEVKYKSVMRS